MSQGFSNFYPIPEYQSAALSHYFANHNPPYPYYLDGKFLNTSDQRITSLLSGERNHGNRTIPTRLFNSTTAVYSPTTGLYNRNGRGIPDVAAIANNVAIVLAGRQALSGGTSAAAPLFAALINRIVEERLRVGKGPVGFLNPVLYANPGMFFDIKNGSTGGCGTKGFEAVEGWDPATGLGTPNYPKMLELFLSLP